MRRPCPSTQDARGAWDVLKAFVDVPFDVTGPQSDGVLYEVGDFDLDGRRGFYVELVRQFAVTDEGGEHDRLEQLRCTFRYPLSDPISSAGTISGGSRAARTMDVLEPLFGGPLGVKGLDLGTARPAPEIRVPSRSPIDMAHLAGGRHPVASTAAEDRLATADPDVLAVATIENLQVEEPPGQGYGRTGPRLHRSVSHGVLYDDAGCTRLADTLRIRLRPVRVSRPRPSPPPCAPR